MQTFNSIAPLTKSIITYRAEGKTIGFVPTMGALHEGHLSLIRACKQSNDITVASIYVNPTQFNDTNDLKNYPRNKEKDCLLLSHEACDIVFTPTDKEMYPEPDRRVFEFGHMGSVMEGKHRPGHFNGVAQVVTKLFDAVKPHRAYFGQKDFQQLAIVRKLVNDLNYPIEIIGCPIIREPDGLAMSSRNKLLTADQRKAAPLIYKTLTEVKKRIKNEPPEAVGKYVESTINSSPFLELEYFQLVATNTMLPVKKNIPEIPVTACIAVFSGSVRLIDNVDIIL